MEKFKQELITEVSIKINNSNDCLMNLSDVNEFISRIDISKDQIIRVFSWMIHFGIIEFNGTTFGEQIIDLHHRYIDLVNERIGGFDINPLDFVPSESQTIQADVKRSHFLFEKTCENIGIEMVFQENVLEIAYRVLCMLSLCVESLVYTQGFDRFMLHTYALGLLFIKRIGLPIELAESISYYLTREFLLYADISSSLMDPSESEAMFLQLDSMIQVHSPTIYESLTSSNLSSFHFALRWKLLFFADEYESPALYLIWDQLLMNSHRFMDYFFALSLAHVFQIPYEDGPTFVEKAQKHKDWDIDLVFNQTESILSSKTTKPSYGKLLILGGIAASAIAYYYLK